MKRELLFFFAGLFLTAATVTGILFTISFLADITKNTLSTNTAGATSATRFDMEGLKKFGILPQ